MLTMAPEVIGGITILYVMLGTLTALFICTFDDDLSGPEGVVIGILWPLSIVAVIVIGAIRLVRRFNLL